MEKHPGNIFHACTLNLIFHPCLLRLGIHLLKKDVDLKEKERGKNPVCYNSLLGKIGETWGLNCVSYKEPSQAVDTGPVFVTLAPSPALSHWPLHSAQLSVMKNLSFIFSSVSCEKACQLKLTLPFAKRPISHADNTLLYLCFQAPDNPLTFLLSSPVMMRLKLHILGGFKSRFCW